MYSGLIYVERKPQEWVGRLSNEPATQSITGTGRFLTRSTLFLGASLQALVDAELVGALLDGKDGGAGGDALRQRGWAGGRNWSIVRIVNILWHVACIFVLVRVVQVVNVVKVILLLLILVLVYRDLLNGDTTREFLTSCGDWPMFCCCCCCWPPGGCPPSS